MFMVKSSHKFVFLKIWSFSKGRKLVVKKLVANNFCKSKLLSKYYFLKMVKFINKIRRNLFLAQFFWTRRLLTASSGTNTEFHFPGSRTQRPKRPSLNSLNTLLKKRPGRARLFEGSRGSAAQVGEGPLG